MDLDFRQVQRLGFSGGGMLGVSYFGFLSKLALSGCDFTSPSRNVKSFCGTSVGALIAFLCYARVDFSAERPAFALITPFIDRMTRLQPASLLSGYLHDGSTVRRFISKTIYQITGLHEPTFKELSNLIGVQDELVICATNITKQTPTYFSANTTPDVRVSNALFASMCIPLLFPPTRIAEQSYIDGGSSDNSPVLYDLIERYAQRSSSLNCLMVRLRSGNKKTRNAPHTLFQVTKTVVSSAHHYEYQKQVLRILHPPPLTVYEIAINCPPEVSGLAFTANAVSSLLRAGETSACSYLESL